MPYRPIADLQKSQKIDIEKLAFSLHMSPSTASGTRPEVDVFYLLIRLNSCLVVQNF